MAGILDELVSGIVKSAMSEILKKSHGRTATRRTKRRTRTAKNEGLVESIIKAALPKPAKKQVSRRRTSASRSKQRHG